MDGWFWKELEAATWVVWDKRQEYCYVQIPGKGSQVFHYQEGRVRRVARGPKALILARRLGIAPSEDQRGSDGPGEKRKEAIWSSASKGCRR